MPYIYVCDTCDTELPATTEYCPEHPDASISTIWPQPLPSDMVSIEESNGRDTD